MCVLAHVYQRENTLKSARRQYGAPIHSAHPCIKEKIHPNPHVVNIVREYTRPTRLLVANPKYAAIYVARNAAQNEPTQRCPKCLPAIVRCQTNPFQLKIQTFLPKYFWVPFLGKHPNIFGRTFWASFWAPNILGRTFWTDNPILLGANFGQTPQHFWAHIFWQTCPFFGRTTF